MQFQGLAVILNAAQFCAQQEVVKRIGCVRFTGGLYSGMEQDAGNYYEKERWRKTWQKTH